MRNKKRFLSLLLSLALVFSMVAPTSVMAAPADDNLAGVTDVLPGDTGGNVDTGDNTGSNTDSDAGDIGDSNTGDSNIGESDTGDSNTGDSNIGESNPGDSDTGDSNTGESNPGDSNTGEGDSGDSNTGDSSTGDSDTGDSDTGESDTGDSSTGESNPGDSDTGDDTADGQPVDDGAGLNGIPETQPALAPIDGAVTYYVANSAEGGSNVSGTGAYDMPFLSISHAIDVARENQVTDLEIAFKSNIDITNTLILDDSDMSITFQGNEYTLNAALNDNAGTGNAAIAVIGGADVTFTNITLARQDGSAYKAGVLYVQGASAVIDQSRLTNGLKAVQDIDDGGSALYVDSGADVLIQHDTDITNNASDSQNTSGAVYVANGGSLEVTGVRIFSNDDVAYGDGIYVQNGGTLDIYSNGDTIEVQDEIFIEAGANASVGAANGQSSNINLTRVFLETEETEEHAIATLDIDGETSDSNIGIEVYDTPGKDEMYHYAYRLISTELSPYEIDRVAGQKDETGWQDNCGTWDIRYMDYNGVPGLYFCWFTLDATFSDVSTLTGIDGKDIDGTDANYYPELEIDNSVLSDGDTMLTIPEIVPVDDGDFAITFTADEAGKVYRIPTAEVVRVYVSGADGAEDYVLQQNKDYVYTPDFENGTASLVVSSEFLSSEYAHEATQLNFRISAEKYYKLTLQMNGPMYSMSTDITGLKMEQTLMCNERISDDGSTISYAISRAGEPVEGVTVVLYRETRTPVGEQPSLDGWHQEQVTDASGVVTFTGLDGSYSYYYILYYSDTFDVIARDKVSVALSALKGQHMDDRCEYDDAVVDVSYSASDIQNWSTASSVVTNTTADTTVIYFIELAQDVIQFHANQGDATTADTATFIFDGSSYRVDLLTKSMETNAETYGVLPTMTMTGYKFLGWFTEPQGGQQIFSYTEYDTVSSVKDLYAHWEPIHVGYDIQHWVELTPEHVYGPVHHDANPGYEKGVTPTTTYNGRTYYLWQTDDIMDDTDDIADVTLDSVLHRALTELETEQYSWWTIDGFTVTADGPVQVLADGSSVFGVYYTRNIYTITFDPLANDGYQPEGSMMGDRTTMQVRYGADCGSDLTDSIPGLLMAQRPGYIFYGWWYDLDQDGQYLHGNDIVVNSTSWYTWTEDITVHAQYVQSDTTYKIVVMTEDKSLGDDGVDYADGTYTAFKTVANGNNGLPLPGISDREQVVHVDEIASLSIPGFTYAGYNLTGDRENPVFTASDDGTYMVKPAGDKSTVIYLYYTRNEAVVNFYDDTADNSPEIFDSVTVVYGDTFDNALPETNPTKPGYDFTNWADEHGNVVGPDTETNDYTANGSVTMSVYPVWTAREYFITYVPGDKASFDVSMTGVGYEVDSSVPGGYVVAKPVTYGEKMGVMPTAAKTGYEFDGWFTADGQLITEDTVVSIDSVIIANDANTFEETETLYAHYTPYEFNLELDPGEGSIPSGEHYFTVTYGEPIPELPDAELTGHTFVGWMLDMEDAGQTMLKPGELWTYLTEDGATVTAHAMYYPNIYHYNFNLNDASEGNGSTNATLYNSDMVGVDVEFGSQWAEVIEGIVAQRNGYVFVGWSLTQSKVFEPYTLVTGVSDVPDGNATLYAIWRPVISEMRVYTSGGVIDNDEPFSWNKNYAGQYYEQFSAVYGSEFNLESMQKTEEVMDGVVSYYSVPVIFDTVYGALEPVIYPGEFDVNGDFIPETAEYEFTGYLVSAPRWYSGDSQVLHGQVVTSIDVPFTDYVDEYIRLDAQKIPYFNFVIDTARPGYENATFEDGTTSKHILKSDIAENGLPVVVNDGYEFLGWRIDGEGRILGESEILALTEHCTLVAVMTPLVTFDGNGGQVIVNGQGYDTYSIGIATLLDKYSTLFTARRDGFSFMGWRADGNLFDVNDMNNLASRTTPVTLTAEWGHLVNFIVPDLAKWPDGSNGSRSYDLTAVMDWQELPEMTLTGHTFTGWFDNNLKPVSLADIKNGLVDTVYAYFGIPGGEPVEPGDENINIRVTNYADGVISYVAPENGWKTGTNSFTVSVKNAGQVAAVALVRNEVATELTCVKVNDTTYTFTADGLVNDDEIVLVLLGDADLDGVVTVTDSAKAMQVSVGVFTFNVRECVQNLAADVDRDGVVTVTDSAKIMQQSVGVYTPIWNVVD